MSDSLSREAKNVSSSSEAGSAWEREGEGGGSRKAQNLTRVSHRSWILKIGYNFPG